MNFKEKKEPVTKRIFSLNLGFTEEDKKQIGRLIESYFRKRTNFVNSCVENLAGGLLWVYSRINFLFQDDTSWSQQNIAEMLSIKPKAVSNTASRIMDALRIDCFDERFARKEVAEQNPLNNLVMTRSGFILHKDQIKEIIIDKMLKDASEQGLIEKDDVGNISNEIKSSGEPYPKDKLKNKKISDFIK